MFRESNQKLQKTRDTIVELIAELDMVLEDVREVRRFQRGKDGLNGSSETVGEPEYLSRIAQQRELLMSVAAMLADMRFEWQGGPTEVVS